MNDTKRVVQFTPPGSACTMVFGTGMPGSPSQALRQPGQNFYQAETNTGEDVAVRARAALRPGGPRPA
jgi:hypothetical protein